MSDALGAMFALLIFIGLSFLVVRFKQDVQISRDYVARKEILERLIYTYSRLEENITYHIQRGSVSLEDLWTVVSSKVGLLEAFGFEILWKNNEKKMIAWKNENGHFIQSCSLGYSDELTGEISKELDLLDQRDGKVVTAFLTIPFASDEELKALMLTSTVKYGRFIKLENLRDVFAEVSRDKAEIIKAKELLG